MGWKVTDSSGAVKGVKTLGFQVFTSAGEGKSIISMTGVTGVLPVANGGTNATGFTATRIPYFDGTRFVDDADLTFAVDTLTATKAVHPTSLTTPIITSTGALVISAASATHVTVEPTGGTGAFIVGTGNKTLYVDVSGNRVGVGGIPGEGFDMNLDTARLKSAGSVTFKMDPAGGNFAQFIWYNATSERWRIRHRDGDDYLAFFDARKSGGSGNQMVITDITGNVGLGVDAPSANLHIKAGGTGAGLAPFKLTSGGPLTTAEAGAMEFTTDNFYLTITTAAARKGIVLDDGTALTSGRVPFATTNGRLTDDADLTFATDTLTATKIVGSTSVKVGTAAGFIAADGSPGVSGTFTTADAKTVTVKDGLIVSIV